MPYFPSCCSGAVCNKETDGQTDRQNKREEVIEHKGTIRTRALRIFICNFCQAREHGRSGGRNGITQEISIPSMSHTEANWCRISVLFAPVRVWLRNASKRMCNCEHQLIDVALMEQRRAVSICASKKALVNFPITSPRGCRRTTTTSTEVRCEM